MAATLKQRIEEDVKAALRLGDKRRVAALRFALAAIKQREIDDRIALDDAGTIKVLERLARQRKESIEAYRKGGRSDLVEQESFELQLMQEHLPQPLAGPEIERIIEKAITELGASSPKDVGRVMAVLKVQCQGRADLGDVSRCVRERLARQ